MVALSPYGGIAMVAERKRRSERFHSRQNLFKISPMLVACLLAFGRMTPIVRECTPLVKVLEHLLIQGSFLIFTIFYIVE
jgi:hypothetical protein